MEILFTLRVYAKYIHIFVSSWGLNSVLTSNKPSDIFRNVGRFHDPFPTLKNSVTNINSNQKYGHRYLKGIQRI